MSDRTPGSLPLVGSMTDALCGLHVFRAEPGRVVIQRAIRSTILATPEQREEYMRALMESYRVADGESPSMPGQPPATDAPAADDDFLSVANRPELLRQLFGDDGLCDERAEPESADEDLLTCREPRGHDDHGRHYDPEADVTWQRSNSAVGVQLGRHLLRDEAAR